MNNRPTPETDAAWQADKYTVFRVETSRRLERGRDEAREALREIWQSGDAFLPHVDEATTSRWRKAAGWEETK